MKKERTYFAQVLLKDGRYVCIVFTSEDRRGTHGNQLDLLMKANGKADINTAHYIRKKFYRGTYYNEIYMHDNIYPMDKKNMEEECFNDYEVIDLR